MAGGRDVLPVWYARPDHSRKEFSDGPCGTISEIGERSEKENQRNQCRGCKAPQRRGREVSACGCSRGQRMGEGTSSRRHSYGPRYYRARHRAAGSRHERETGSVLRRGIPFRTCGRQSAENGLQQRRIDGRRLEGLAGSGFAYRQRLAASGRDLDWKKLAGAEGFEPSPSSLTVRCPTSWTTAQRRAAEPRWP